MCKGKRGLILATAMVLILNLPVAFAGYTMQKEILSSPDAFKMEKAGDADEFSKSLMVPVIREVSFMTDRETDADDKRKCSHADENHPIRPFKTTRFSRQAEMSDGMYIISQVKRNR